MAEAALAMNGTLLQGSPDAAFEGIAYDSRRLEGGELFFALEGEATDGHRFVKNALSAEPRCAAGAVVSRRSWDGDLPEGACVIEVADTFAALHDLTRSVRRTVPRHLIGITGSAGKTTTKEFMVALLDSSMDVAGSPGNLNNLYGFPQALLGMRDDLECMVAEMGMSTPGELAGVSRLARPDLAVFTNIRLVHIESFEDAGEAPTLRTITEAKAGLLEGHQKGGVIIGNRNDPEIRFLVDRHLDERDEEARACWYAVAEGKPLAVPGEPACALRVHSVEGIDPGPGYSFLVEIDPSQLPRLEWSSSRGVQESETVRIELPVHGRVNVENFAAAATAALVCGASSREIVDAARTLAPEKGRGELLELRLPDGGTARVIDDSYNSNPDAASKALASAKALPAARHWCVLGAMLELGSAARNAHKDLGQQAAALGFEPVVGVGALARSLVEEAKAAGKEAHHFENVEAAALALPLSELLQDGDLVLVKGSRGIKLEQLLQEWLRDAEAATGHGEVR